jgi:hypothetical protein
MPRHKKPDNAVMLRKLSPFTTNLLIPVRYAENKEVYTTDGLGEKKKEEDHDKELREQTPFVKLFRRPDLRAHKAKLSPSAAHLYMWIMDTIPGAVDFISINMQRYIQESRNENEPRSGTKSANTFRKAITELIDGGFLAKSTIEGTYFINPTYFFFGSRITMYPKNLILYLTEKERDTMDGQYIMNNIQKRFDKQQERLVERKENRIKLIEEGKEIPQDNQEI